MSSSDQNRLSIRIEISAPAGVSVSTADLGSRPRRVSDGTPFSPFFVPVSPSTQGCQVVTLESGTQLGSVSVQISYPTDPPDQVKAMVFPALLWEDHAQPHRSAVDGISSNLKSLWSWGAAGGNRLQGADHLSTDPGASNVLSVWRKNGTADWVPDGNLVFFGKTGACGSGSGPMPLFVGGAPADTARLLVVVPDGPNAGQYHAAPQGQGRWGVSIRSTAYEISTPDGMGFTLRRSCGSAVSTTAAFSPFSATFSGAMLGAAHAVVVVRA